MLQESSNLDSSSDPLFTLLCALWPVTLILDPPKASPPSVAIAVGVVLLLPCFWILEKCFRLVIGRKKQGGLMAPNTLRGISWLFLALPFGGLFTGYYRERGFLAVYQAVMYVFAFLGLRSLARAREAKHNRSTHQSAVDLEPPSKEEG